MTESIPCPGKDLAQVRGVVFDCDGVLFDSREVNRRFYNQIRAGIGLSDMSPAEEEFAFMHTVDEAMRLLIPADRMDAARSIQEQMDYRDFVEAMVPEPGLLEFLDFLRAQGVCLGINTNRKNSMEPLLERYALDVYFSPVITAAKVQKPKPDPEGLLAILALWELSADEVAYIGDSLLDEQASSAAGVPFWAYGNSSLRAALHVDSFCVLRHCFEREYDKK